MTIRQRLTNVLQHLHRIITTAQINSNGTRSFNFWSFHRRFYSWTTKLSSRNPYDSRILLGLAAGFSFKDFAFLDQKFKPTKEVTSEFDVSDDVQHGWEILVDEPDFQALRRKLNVSGELYEYKCVGTYYDISPRNFLDAQNDISYRTEWDRNIICLELLAEDEHHELLRWISKFPYPMSAREYVYVRRTWVSDNATTVVVESKVVPEDVVPSLPNTSNVRVSTYNSKMAIRAHGDWNEHGVDFILTYSDDPEAKIPRYVYNWIVNQGGPYFLKQVHAAALDLELSGREVNSILEKFYRPVEPPSSDKGVASDLSSEEEVRETPKRRGLGIIPGIKKQNMDNMSKMGDKTQQKYFYRQLSPPSSSTNSSLTEVPSIENRARNIQAMQQEEAAKRVLSADTDVLDPFTNEAFNPNKTLPVAPVGTESDEAVNTSMAAQLSQPKPRIPVSNDLASFHSENQQASQGSQNSVVILTSSQNSQANQVQNYTLRQTRANLVVTNGPRREYVPSKKKRTRPVKRANPVDDVIYRLSRSANLLIPRVQFGRAVREVCDKVCMDMNVELRRWQSAALEALQVSAEYYLLNLFMDAYIAAAHVKRRTMMPRDIQLVLRMRSAGDPGKHLR